MQQLLPTPLADLTDDQIAAAYDWPAAPAGRPWIRANFAHTADGSFTDADGLSAGVSNDADRHVFSILRATCDAVLAGAGTARAENYGPITIRPELQPLRDAANRKTNPLLFIASNSNQINERAAGVAHIVPLGKNSAEMDQIFSGIAQQGVQRLLCEGGPHLFTDLLAADLVDDICLTTTPKLLGPSDLQLLTRPVSKTLELTSLLEDNGTLLARWTVQR